jgi:glycosyltransferase involved in cell wall biosynthesis
VPSPVAATTHAAAHGALCVGYSLATLAPGVVGGTESYARGLLGGLLAAPAARPRLRVIANPTAAATYGPRLAETGAELVVVPGRFTLGLAPRALSMLAMTLAARPLARRFAAGLDVLHYPATIPLPRVRGIPVVQTLHDVQHREHPQYFSRAELAFRRLAYDRGATSADRVVTVSSHAREQIVEHLGIEPERIDVIAHGLDHERFAAAPVEDDAALLRPLDLPERWVLYPANLWPHKNHDRLIDALALTERRETHLVLTGQAYGHRDALLERARAAGVHARVHHLGHVPGALLAPLYRAAAGLVFPSLFEGFGIPAIEAMACGCPVAASDRSALPEVVAGAGILFDATDPADIARAIDELVSAPRGPLVAAGLARAAQFTWERCAAEHLDSYRAALSAS